MPKLDRRNLLSALPVLAALGISPSILLLAGRAEAQPALGPPQPFDWDRLKAMASGLSAQPWIDPGDQRPQQLADLPWDRYEVLRYRPEQALWAGDDLPFQIQFFHLGSHFKSAVRIFEVANGEARPIEYDPSLFDYGPTTFDPPLPHDLGFAGWRLHSHLKPQQDVAVFLGASYLRATDAGDQYGISARGLAIDTAMDRPEEFPMFTRFWLVRPAPTDTVLTVFALLESESVTGAYRFAIDPGGMTIMDIVASLYPRKPIQRLGIAPMTSMFWFGENERRGADEWREEIHDSDGLSMWRGNGEWVWRPLANPPELRVSTFIDENPKGFGLLQRDRDFTHYQDEAYRYERRPSVWIEPHGDWGKGAIVLTEIPTEDETFDNIVAFWQPESQAVPGQEIQLAYRLTFAQTPPLTPRLAWCANTRIGKGGVIGQPNPKNLRKFVIDFVGGDLPLIPKDAPVEPVITLSRGKVEPQTSLGGLFKVSPYLRPLPQIGGWRVTFDVSWEGTEPIDMRLYLRLGPTALTETWLYLWTPPYA
ncbi:MAG: glucan biosynthesis protein [Geminicoccaceae bacterium]